MNIQARAARMRGSGSRSAPQRGFVQRARPPAKRGVPTEIGGCISSMPQAQKAWWQSELPSVSIWTKSYDCQRLRNNGESAQQNSRWD
jgi:hypothetical protein